MAQPPPKPQTWPEKDELCLLTAVLEIAREPAESYDPRINLFDRIGKSLVKSFTNKEVLAKVKELKRRYEKKNRAIRLGDDKVKRTAAFKISEKIWGDEVMKEEEEKKEAQSIRTSEDSKKHGHEVEHLKPAEPKPTACTAKTNPHEASSYTLKRAHEPTQKRDDDAGPKKKSKRRRGKKNAPCLNCRKPGHFASDCPEENKIEKDPIKQNKTKDIQPEGENKCEEQSSKPISTSSQPGSHQSKPQQTRQRAESHNSPQHGAHRLTPQKTRQRAGSHNIPQHGSHRLSPEKNRVHVSNTVQAGAHQRSQQNWNRRLPLPPISPQTATWEPPRHPIPTRYPPPQMPYRYPPPHPMNYTCPPNYNYPMFNNTNHPTTNFNRPPYVSNYPMFNGSYPPMTSFNPRPAENPGQFPPPH